MSWESSPLTVSVQHDTDRPVNLDSFLSGSISSIQIVGQEHGIVFGTENDCRCFTRFEMWVRCSGIELRLYDSKLQI